MYDLRLDNDSDIIVQDQDLALTRTAQDLLKQKIYVIFRTFAGEWYLNTQFGGYNKDVFLNKSLGKSGVDAYFISILNSLEEVEEVVTFSSEFAGTERLYTCRFDVRTTSGTGRFDINILPPGTELSYPSSGIGLDTICSTVDASSVNDFYELMNIRIPTEIPWD